LAKNQVRATANRQETMMKSTKCWVCGRTPEEVRDAVGKPIPVETEVDRSMAKVVAMKANFSKLSGEWATLVPEQFKSMDFRFVMKNADQFKSIAFIGDVENAGRSYVEGLGEAVTRVRKGEEAGVGELMVDPKDAKRKEILLKGVEEFEKRSGRMLGVQNGGKRGSAADHPMPAGFEGLRLGEGIRYLRDAGMVYYSIQQSLLEAAKAEEASKKPAFGVGSTRLGGFSKAVPLCTVCENLIREL
jgi:hypothetical protein